MFFKNTGGERVKETVHLKMKILSSTQKEDIVKNEGNSSIFSPTIEVNGAPKQPDYKLSSEYLPLCSAQTHSYRFGST